MPYYTSKTPSGKVAVHGPRNRFKTFRADQQLRDELPHLTEVFSSISDYQQSAVSIYDFDQTWQPLSTDFHTLRYQREVLSMNFDNIITSSLPNTAARVIVVEDISELLMADLINHIDISLEVFREHLINCGRDGPNIKPDLDSSTWNSRRIAKSHFSIRWYRPYTTDLQNRSMTIAHKVLTVREVQDSITYDDDDDDELSDFLGDDEPRISEYRLSYKANIWRRHLGFHMNNISFSGLLQTSSREALDMAMFADEGVSVLHNASESSSNHTSWVGLAAEERVTVWYGACDAHRLVLVLTDPGFCSSFNKSSLTGGVVPGQLFVTRQSRSKSRRERVLRKSEDIQGASKTVTKVKVEPLLLPRSSQEVAPAGVVDSAIQGITSTKASGQSSPASAGKPYQSGLVEEIADREQVPPYDAEGVLPIESSSGNNAPGKADSIASVPATTQTNEPGDVSLNFIPPSETKLISFLRNIASRCPCEHVDLDEARENGYFTPLTTTREDFGAWVECAASQKLLVESPLGVVDFFFKIVYNDTLDFLQMVERYLDDIINAAEDEVELGKNIASWRKMLSHLDQQLRWTITTVPAFATFLTTSQASQMVSSGNNSMRQSVDELILKTEKLRQHLQQTNTLITSAISVAESRRGISEAESVTRLTELAFIYVPLSFAASFFGMQVKELNPETTSIGGFFGLAIGVVGLSYLVRLLIRSQFLIQLRTSTIHSVRREYHVPDGQPIRTRDFLLWMWYHGVVDNVTFSFSFHDLAGLFMMLIPFSSLVIMISVWASKTLLPGMKVAISVAAVMIIIGLVGFSCLLDRRSFRDSIRDMAKARRRQREKLRRRRARQNQEPTA